jgi:hypothetical protein
MAPILDDSVLAVLDSTSVSLVVEDGAYPTVDTALAALDQVLNLYDLPPPNVIWSIGLSGLHLTWVLGGIVARPERQAITAAMLDACKSLGFRAEAMDRSMPVVPITGGSFKFGQMGLTEDDLIHPSSRRTA